MLRAMLIDLHVHSPATAGCALAPAQVLARAAQLGLDGVAFTDLNTLSGHKELLASAKDGEYDQADGLDLGADDYLTKPFSFVVLLARLRALLRRGARPRPPLIEVGMLTFDPAARVFAMAGEPLDLTARESAMLEYLVRQHPRAVTKAELLEHVWPDATTDQNAVEIYAGYLRRKLGRAALQTVRGVGYRLRPP